MIHKQLECRLIRFNRMGADALVNHSIPEPQLDRLMTRLST